MTGKTLCELFGEAEHERAVLRTDARAGYRGIIAIHSTALGPAFGGARFCRDASDAEAGTDALRLARGMTYRNALAGLPFGGGKSVIIGDNRAARREEIFRAHTARRTPSRNGAFAARRSPETRPRVEGRSC